MRLQTASRVTLGRCLYEGIKSSSLICPYLLLQMSAGTKRQGSNSLSVPNLLEKLVTEMLDSGAERGT